MSYDTTTMKIGTYLVHKGILPLEQAKDILLTQQNMSGQVRERFGRIAIKKGYITEAKLNEVMMAKYQMEIKS